jgi:hypothetical protein
MISSHREYISGHPFFVETELLNSNGDYHSLSHVEIVGGIEISRHLSGIIPPWRESGKRNPMAEDTVRHRIGRSHPMREHWCGAS